MLLLHGGMDTLWTEALSILKWKSDSQNKYAKGGNINYNLHLGVQTQLFENARGKLQSIHQREAPAFIQSKINNLKVGRNTPLVLKLKQILFKVFHSSSTDFLSLESFQKLFANLKLTDLQKISCIGDWVVALHIISMHTKNFFFLNSQMQPNFTAVMK